MKKTVIHIPSGGLPPRVPASDDDSPLHARLRVAIGLTVAVVYLLLVAANLTGKVDLPWTVGVLFGCFGVIMIPAVHYGIRPGTGRTWLIALAVTPLIVFFPWGLVPVVVIALFCQGIALLRGDGETNEKASRSGTANNTSDGTASGRPSR